MTLTKLKMGTTERRCFSGGFARSALEDDGRNGEASVERESSQRLSGEPSRLPSPARSLGPYASKPARRVITVIPDLERSEREAREPVGALSSSLWKAVSRSLAPTRFDEASSSIAGPRRRWRANTELKSGRLGRATRRVCERKRRRIGRKAEARAEFRASSGTADGLERGLGALPGRRDNGAIRKAESIDGMAWRAGRGVCTVKIVCHVDPPRMGDE
ncbi:hypothetical protein KM043_001334 [Ampulex compressa]|nr:hypothetical protein KM043_001334 [Ampulex compressa]